MSGSSASTSGAGGGKHETHDDVVAHYLPALEGREPTDLYLILLDGEPAGFVQTSLVRDYPERLHTLVRAERQGDSRSSDQPSPFRS